jgi:hypothetical protein
VKRLFLVLVCVIIVGCSTNDGRPYSPPPPPPEGKVLVYLMRTNVVYGSAYPTIFFVNDSAVTEMKDWGYSWVYVSPGAHKFSAGRTSKGVNFSIVVAPGRDYFVEYSQENTGYQSYVERIREVEPVVGKAMVGRYTYREESGRFIF